MRKTNANGTIILTTEFERKQTYSRDCKKVLTFYVPEQSNSLKSTQNSYLNNLNFKPSTNPYSMNQNNCM